MMLGVSWTCRMPVLWAFLPLITVSMVERMAFHTSYIGSLFQYRLMGALPIAFDVTPAKSGHFAVIDRLSQLNPARFLSTPGLWLGLLLAAAFLSAAGRLGRDPAT